MRTYRCAHRLHASHLNSSRPTCVVQECPLSSLDAVMAEGAVTKTTITSHQGGPRCSGPAYRRPPSTSINIHATNDSGHASTTHAVVHEREVVIVVLAVGITPVSVPRYLLQLDHACAFKGSIPLICPVLHVISVSRQIGALVATEAAHPHECSQSEQHNDHRVYHFARHCSV